MLIKICGIKNKNIIKCCEENNVNLFGLIFYPKSPRNVSLIEAHDLVKYSINYKIKPVGVFVNEPIKNLIKIINFIDLKYIQLHGEENQNYINMIKENKKNTKIIKKISIRNRDDFILTDKYKYIDYFLFDYKAEDNELPGGNAKQFDWRLLENLNIHKPWFLSGGINKSNINKIKKFSNPDGIDLSSGVEEAPGIKNKKMINEILKNI